MSILSESRHGNIFRLRWRYRLLWCHGCGKRMDASGGVLTRIDRDKIQWGCLDCYARAEREAAVE